MAWSGGNRYLTRAEMEGNAWEIHDYFISQGATLNAVCAMLGNMETESGINPGIWESLIEYGGGYGLVQWTPYTKYSEWAGEGWENNGQRECERIIYEALHGIQWFSNPNAPIVDPPFSFTEFLTSDLPPATLADYFLWYYEHPAETIQPVRGEQANAWYTFLTGETPPQPPTPSNRRKMPLYMMIRYKL